MPAAKTRSTDSKAMRMKVVFLLGVLASTSPTIKAQTQTGSNETVLQGIFDAGSAAKLPVGIIRQRGDALCQRSVIPDGLQAEAATSATIAALAATAHYHPSMNGEVMAIQPDNISKKLQSVMVYRYPSFPKLEGTPGYMGQVLQGWLSTTFNGARGYGGESVQAGPEEDRTLPALKSATPVEIANAIVALPPKGLWVLEEVAGKDGRSTEVNFTLFPYGTNPQKINAVLCSEGNSH
jgi:hypothetical protein